MIEEFTVFAEEDSTLVHVHRISDDHCVGTFRAGSDSETVRNRVVYALSTRFIAEFIAEESSRG